MKEISGDVLSILELSFLSNASHLELEVEARKSFNKFSDNVSPLLFSQILSIKTSFREKIANLKFAKKMAFLLIVKNASLATTYPDVCTAYMVYMTVTVTVATAERSFSKHKLIKTFFKAPCPKKDLAVWCLVGGDVSVQYVNSFWVKQFIRFA